MRPFHYRAPRSLDEALALLTPQAVPLAGGTDLFLKMERRQTQADTVVDLKRIPELDRIEAADGGVRIGALALMDSLGASSLIAGRYEALTRSARVVGSIQTRNRATLGGNLANASPAADTATPLMALGASAEAADATGTRQVPVDQLFLGPGRTALRDGEILTAVLVPALPARAGSAFQRCVRTAMDIALVNCAAFVRLDGDDPDTVAEARIALGAVGPTPLRTASAENCLQTTNPRHPFHLRYKTGVKHDGTITAREIEVVLGTGFSAGSGVMISQGAAVRAPGPYRIPNLKIDSYCVYTNTSTCGAYRGPAGPQLAFASESQMDIIARELGIDPVEMRLRNAMVDGDETPAGAPLEDVHAKETLLKAAEAMNAVPKPPGNNVGRGMAMAHWLVGGMASSAGVKLNEDGTVAILTGLVDLSGASTSLAQIAAEVLGVSLDDVHVRTADTDFAPHSTLSAGSQALKSMGGAVLLAAREAKRQIQQVAADKLEADPGDLELDGNNVFVKGSPERSVTLREVDQLALEHERGPIVSTQSVSRLTPHPAMAAHAAEVEVDPETGHVRIHRYVAAQDVGTAVNPLSVRGQIEGGVMQGLGQALSEACTFTDGKMDNPNLLDYKIFSALDAPPVEVHLIQHPCASGPLGAKGVGEPPIIPPPAVMANAVFDAVGVRIHDLPITPEKIVKALKGKRSAQP